jgi:hypothetical protein
MMQIVTLTCRALRPPIFYTSRIKNPFVFRFQLVKLSPASRFVWGKTSQNSKASLQCQCDISNKKALPLRPLAVGDPPLDRAAMERKWMS